MTVVEAPVQPRPQHVHLERGRLRAQGWLVLLVLALVGYADQLSKAWAWRHVTGAHINAGGDMLVSPAVGSWFADPVLGACFDVLDAVLLAGAGLLLTRRRRHPLVLLSGSLVLAGWTSNLADRLGMHYGTAPGSVRGAVDFLPFDGRYWNLADIAIVAGSAALGVSVLVAATRGFVASRPAVALVRRPFAGRLARTAAVCGLLAVGVLAAVGAIAYSGVDSPATFATA